MARVFIDGFEAGDLKLWNDFSGATITTGVSGMDGTYCCYITADGNYYLRKIVAAAAEYYCAFRLRPHGYSPTKIIKFLSESTVLADRKSVV